MSKHVFDGILGAMLVAMVAAYACEIRIGRVGAREFERASDIYKWRARGYLLGIVVVAVLGAVMVITSR